MASAIRTVYQVAIHVLDRFHLVQLFTYTQQQRLRFLGELAIADDRTHPALSIFTDWEERATFKPAAMHTPIVEEMIDEVVSWNKVLKTVREVN